MSVFGTFRSQRYKAAAQATNHLSPEQQEVLIRATIAAKKYCKTGFLRIEGNNVVVVLRGEVKHLPSIDEAVLWFGPQQTVAFLTKSAGIAQVANTIQDFGDNPF